MAGKSSYTNAMGNRIIELVETHALGLPSLIKKYPDLPPESTINKWRKIHPEFGAKYAQAKLIQADLLAEECLSIADDSSQDIMRDSEGNEVPNKEFIARSRLRIDTRKWLASKLLPKAYGDRTVVDQTVTIKHEDALEALE